MNVQYVEFLPQRACAIVLSYWLPKAQLRRLEVASEEDSNSWS